MAYDNVEYYEKLKQLQEKQHSRLVIVVLTEQRNNSYCRPKAKAALFGTTYDCILAYIWVRSSLAKSSLKLWSKKLTKLL